MYTGGTCITQRSGALSPFHRPCFIAPWRRRQRLLEETAEEREARLGKRREAWIKRLLKRKVSKVLSSQRYIPMIL